MDGDAQTFDDHVGCSVETRHGADFVPREGHLAQKGSQIPSQDAFYARLSRKSPEPRASAESRAILVGKTEVPVQGSSEGHRAAKKSSSDSVLWMFKSESGWMPFSDGNNVYIESKYKSGVDCVVIYPYQIDLIRFVQTNLLTGTERCILRGDRNYLSISNGRSSRDLEALSSLMSIISFDALGVFKNLFNPHFEAGHSPRHASLQTVKKEVPAKTADGGLSGRSKIKIPKLPIGNCQAEKPTESPRSRVPFECPSLSPAGGRMARSQAGSGSNVKGRCRCGSGSCSRMVQYDAASMGGGALSEDDEREDGRDRSDAPIRLGSPRSEGFVERPSSFYPPGELDDGEIEVYLHSILGSDLLSSSTKLNAESSLAPAPAAAPAAAQSNGCAGAQDGAESERLDRQLISSKTASGSKSLFFFTPHKYRKRVGIIVPRILSCRLNTKKATKGSESEASSKFVRFNCSFMSPDKSKHSLGGYISTPRRTSPKAGKESRSGRRGVVTRATETASDGPEPRSPEPERPSGASSQAPRDSTATSTVQTDSLKAFSVRSAFIVLNEDSIPFDISDDCGPSPLFGELEGGYGYERGEEGGGGYLSTLSAWSRAGRVQSEFFETMSEREFNSRRMSMTTLHDFDDEEAVSDTDARPPADKDSRRLISLEDFDGGAGGLRQISWWFNHSVRHITVKLNCEHSSPNKRPTSLEILPLLKPLLTGYLIEQPPGGGSLHQSVQLPGVSTHVLLGLKSLEIVGLRPSKAEFHRISEFCFTELNNIIPISLEELSIVQSIIPISIFSLLLTRFPVPAASTFAFSLICNDDELPNTGLQTIQVINLHLSQNPCSHIKRRNRYGKSKGRRRLAYSGDSTCSHVHLDIFRLYNHVKICPWLAISNFVDEFVLRTPILVKCIIDPHNIMVVPSMNARNLHQDSRLLYDSKDQPLGGVSVGHFGEMPRGAEFVILTANLILPLLIIQSHSIQSIIIGGGADDLQCEPSATKIATKLRVDSIVFTCKCLPFKFFRIRNLDLFLDLNIDKTELGLFIRSHSKGGATEASSFSSSARESERLGPDSEQDTDDYCFQQLYNSIDYWIDEFSTWLDKYVCCGSIEILRINLYVTSRYLELKVNGGTSASNPVSKESSGSQENGGSPEPEPPRDGSSSETARDFLNFDPLYGKFLSKSQANHSSLKSVMIKICISNHLQNFILGSKSLGQTDAPGV